MGEERIRLIPHINIVPDITQDVSLHVDMSGIWVPRSTLISSRVWPYLVHAMLSVGVQPDRNTAGRPVSMADTTTFRMQEWQRFEYLVPEYYGDFRKEVRAALRETPGSRWEARGGDHRKT